MLHPGKEKCSPATWSSFVACLTLRGLERFLFPLML